MTRRFLDHGRQIYHFDHEFWVRCPQCDHCAIVTRLQMRTENLRPRARIVCTHCGYTKDKTGHADCTEQPSDGYFCLPLWLQIPCCGHTLWAFNAAHLRLVKEYVAADLREKSSMTWMHLGFTLVPRLPEWMQRANNRDEVLRCIEKLRQTLA